MNSFIIKFKKVNSEAKIPIYATEGSAACDFYSVEDVILSPGETRKIKTGIAIEIPVGYFMKLEGRSGLSSKGIMKVGGVVDSDYRGEIHIILHNASNEPCKIEKGDRIAQGLLMKINTAKFIEVEELSETARGEGGFESTGRR